MVLTEARTSPTDNKFPTVQLSILALCRIAEPIALTSVLPYAFPMVKWLGMGDDTSQAFWAGVLISAFSLAEALTGMFWGGLSDRVGRKPVLLLGCFGTLVSMLMLGFATNYWLALVARVIGGLLNGNIGVIQTMVGELVTDPAHEPRAYAVMPFCWSLGTILGPMIAGLTANSPLFPTLPYLLPNLICAGLLVFSIAIGYVFLVETLRPHEADPRRPDSPDPAEQSAFANAVHSETPLMNNTGATEGADLRSESYGTFNRVDIHRDESWRVNADGTTRAASTRSASPPAPRAKVFTRQVVMCVAALGLFCYHSMVFDSLLPIFLQDARAAVPVASTFAVLPDSVFAAAAGAASPLRGGLGMSIKQVGLIMSVNGVIALFVQGAVFPLAAAWLGVWRLFQLVTLLHPVVYFLVPYLTLLPAASVLPGLYGVLALRNCGAILAYPLLLILLKEACDPRRLGRVNGLGASVGAVARCVAPPLSGVLYGIGKDVGFAGLAWFAGGAVAVAGAVEMLGIRRATESSATVRLPCAAPPAHSWNDEGKEVVHIRVADV